MGWFDLPDWADTALIITAGVVGSLTPAGPLGGAALAALVSGGLSAAEGNSLGDIGKDMLVDGGLALVGGGLAAGVAKAAAAKVGAKAFIPAVVKGGAETIKDGAKWGLHGGFKTVPKYTTAAATGGSTYGDPRDLGPIVITMISEKMTAAGAQVWMPDPDQLPDNEMAWGSSQNPNIMSNSTESLYRGLPNIVLVQWDGFGTDMKTPAPERTISKDIVGEYSAKLKNYPELVAAMRTKYTNLADADKIVAGVVAAAGELMTQGQGEVAKLTGDIKKAASINPQDPKMVQEQKIDAVKSMDDHLVKDIVEPTIFAVEDMTKRYSAELDKFTTQVEAAKTAAAEEAKKKTQVSPEMQALLDENKALKDAAAKTAAATTTANPYGTTAYPPGTTTPTGTGGSYTPSTGTTGTTGTSAATDPTKQAITDAIKNIEAQQAAGQGVTAAPAAPSTGMPMMPGMGMNPMGMGMGQDRGRDRDHNRQGKNGPARGVTAGQAGTTAAGAPAQPTAQPVSASTTAGGPPAGAQAQPASNIVQPTRPVGEDGSVEYVFPDGRTQKVSVVVAAALDAAFGNAAETNATVAYEKTPAKWTADKIGEPVDPYQLMTGDVAKWGGADGEKKSGRTAIVVAFPSETAGTLEVVVEGQLKPYVAEMGDSKGDFGQFAGFFHPKGIEITAPTDPGATAAPTDQSAGAATPVLAAPA